MDAVRAFNNELSSLYETRPPVSRAKMATVTKSAIKAIKFYKHVVQSVEKFVLKCKPEYKIPGLYVIDSIVRQSRHQFGAEKDVFGPRFTKNIVTTFQSLLKCPPDEKCRVIRVLNLWQKNTVFPVEVIQPLLDMAADPTNTDSVLAAQRAVEKVVLAHQRSLGKASNGGSEDSLLAQQSDIVNTVTKLLQQTGEGSLLASGQEVQLQQLQLLQQQLVMHTEMMSSKPQQTPPVIDNNLLAQIKLLTDQLLSKTDAPPSTSSLSQPVLVPQTVPEAPAMEVDLEVKKQAEPGFNRKLLDFDYGESDEEDDRKEATEMQPPLPGGVQKLLNDPTLMQHIHNVSSLKSDQLHSDMQESEAKMRKQHLEEQQEQFNKEIEQSNYSGYSKEPEIIVVEEQDDRESREYDRDRRRSRRSRDRSRSPRRRRHSRSRSRERRRSRDRHRRSRSREHDRERQREKDRERKKNGLPPLKEKHISICSTTLWFGHLAKHTTEDELRLAIQNYGTTESIKMVPPRGCAYVSMTWRREAAKALDRMKGFKLNSSALKVAWAPNIGVKESQFLDFWDVELGVTYIPWNRMPADLASLLNGAVIDEDSLPDHLKGTVIARPKGDMEGKRVSSSDSHNPPQMNQIPNFASQPQSIPSAQQMSLLPPPMLMPPPGQMTPSVQMPPPNLSQLSMPGQMMPGQAGAPQLPHNLLHPPGCPVSTPLSLPAGVSLSQVVSVAASLQGGHLSLTSSSMPGISLDGPLSRSHGISLSSSGSIMLSGQQPGILGRPGLPPQGSPFGLPGLRSGFPLPPQGMRPPFHDLEEPKEWPSDDKLEEEALAEMENEDTDHRMEPPGAPLMSLPVMGMRMRLPGGPRMPMQLPGGSPRPGMMVELGPPISSTGMPLGPGSMLGRPGLLGPRVMQSATQNVTEGMIRQLPPQGLMSQGHMGMRLGMGNQGSRGLGPGNMSMGQRLGMPGSPGMRGLGPGQGPIRFVLGQRPNLVRPGGPFGMDNPHLHLSDVPGGQGDRGLLDDGPPGASGPNLNNGLQGPGMLPSLMMGAALRGGRPGLLGARPNLPVNGGFRFGPGALNFCGPRPEFLHGPTIDKSLIESSQEILPTSLIAGPQIEKSPEYGEGENSPEYGEDFNDPANNVAAQDTDLRGDTDLRTDTDLRPQDTDFRNSGVGAEIGSDKSRHISQWNSADGDAKHTSQEGLADSNGHTSNTTNFPVVSQDKSSAAPNVHQTKPEVLEGAS